MGLHAVYAAGLIGSEGKVYAIEPNQHTFRLLKQNMDINGFLERTNLYNLAISDQAGTGKMYIYQGHAGGSGLSKDASYRADFEEQKVLTDSLDHILGELKGKIDVLKIDVEGAEVHVMNGGLVTLQQNPDITIIMEWRPGHMARQEGEEAPIRIIEIMRSFGYKAYALKYMQRPKAISLCDTKALLKEECDLAFTKRGHIDKIIAESENVQRSVSLKEASRDADLKSRLAFYKQAFKEAIAVQEDLKKQLAFSRQAFYDAVQVQEGLKKEFISTELQM